MLVSELYSVTIVMRCLYQNYTLSLLLCDACIRTILCHYCYVMLVSELYSWKSFATRYNFRYFPAEPTAVALYLQHIIETTKSYHAVDAAYYAISWAHNLAGLASCSENAIVKSVREGAKRLLGTAQINRKEPLTLDQLNLLIRKADLTNGLALRNVCMYSLAFAG